MIPIAQPPLAGEPLSLPTGAAVGSFVLQAPLPGDGFSLRYRATSSTSGGEVVIEEYAPAAISARDVDGSVRPSAAPLAALWEAGRLAFLQESELLSGPLHPALLRFGAVWQLRGTVYRLWPRIDGHSLAALCAMWAEPPTEDRLRGVIEPLLDAVERLHQAGWVHGNIRPAQILMQPDGAPVLLDTGAVRTAIGARLPEPVGWPEPGFRAPELADRPNGHAPGPWSDLFALAAVARCCLGAPRTTEDFSPHLADAPTGRDAGAFVSTFDRALAEDPRLRPQSVAMFRLQLRATGVMSALREPQDGLALTDIPLRASPLQDPSVLRPVAAPVEFRADGLRAEPDAAPQRDGARRRRRSSSAPPARRWPWAVAGGLGAVAIAAVVTLQRLDLPARWLARVAPVAPFLPPAPLRDPGAHGVEAGTPPPVQVLPPSPAAPMPPPAPPDSVVVEPPPVPTVSVPHPPAPANPAPAVVPPAPPPAPAVTTPPRDTQAPPRRRLATDTPAVACAPRTNFSLYRCLQTKCEESRYAAHPQCVRLRQDDELPS